MKVLYHQPSLDSIYASRTIYNGFKNAFTHLGHAFETFTAGDNLESVLDKCRPDLFITASHSYYQKQINLKILTKYRKAGLFVLVKVDFWNSPLSPWRINEARSMSSDIGLVSLIRSGELGDGFFHVVESGDLRMVGFEEQTGYNLHTIPLAADSIDLMPILDNSNKSDIAYLGTCLPDKREFFHKYVFPLSKEYHLRIEGQDWDRLDRILGWAQRFGQYFNIPKLRSLRSPKFKIADEAKMYTNATVSINVHEEYQRRFGGDCNERTFKIPFCGGFQVVDNVSCIKKYLEPGKEVVIGENESDWEEKIRHYLRYPDERLKIIEAGRIRVQNEHTYCHRIKKISEIMGGKI